MLLCEGVVVVVVVMVMGCDDGESDVHTQYNKKYL